MGTSTNRCREPRAAMDADRKTDGWTAGQTGETKNVEHGGFESKNANEEKKK